MVPALMEPAAPRLVVPGQVLRARAQETVLVPVLNGVGSAHADPAVFAEFFLHVRGLRVDAAVVWNIVLGRAIKHIVEG